MKILVTGYGPFFGQKNNPSQQLLRELKRYRGPVELVLKELPVEFLKIETALSELDLTSFDRVLFFGVAGSRTKVSVENLAVNFRYCPKRPDNSGLSYEVAEKIEKAGPLAYESTLNCADLNDFLSESEVESEVSFNAGTFVCNSTLYQGLRMMKGRGQCAFVHLPAKIDTKMLAKVLSRYFDHC